MFLDAGNLNLEKMKRQKVIVWVILSWVGVFFSEAKSQSITVGADCVSSYILRGSYCGSVSIKHSLGIEYKGLTFGAWGSTDLTSPDLELDLALGYVFKGFEVAITDYYFNEIDGVEYNYFKYRNCKTSHTFEATLGYTFNEKFPLSLSWNTYFAGADASYDKKRTYSTYVQLSYPFRLWSIDMTAGVGITPWRGIYADKFNVVDISMRGEKSIPITQSFSLPLFAGIVFNPTTDKAYLIAGVSF